MRFSVVLFVLAALVAWLHAPLFAGGVLGAPDTDLFRATWGFDHQARSAPFWIWTDNVAFPDGAKVVVLPFLSSVLGAPLHAFFGPWNGYSAWVCLLIWAGAAATAWWVREISGSGAAGLLAGGAMLTQPLLLLAETEGTPEHLAYWALPVLLTCLWRARGVRAWVWGVAAGVAGFCLALDNPYGAVFAVLLALFPLWKAERQGQIAFVAASAVGALLLFGLYWGLSLDIPVPQRNANATSLLNWMDWDGGRPARPWDFTHPPTFVPGLTLFGASLLALLRPARTWPWVVVAGQCFVFSLGSAEENAVVLEGWFGGIGSAAAEGIGWLNNHAYPSFIRFPRRWLVPFAFALWTAAGIGLGRVPQEWLRGWIAVFGLAGVTAITLDQTSFREAFPVTQVPKPAFVDFVAGHAAAGAVLVLPTRPIGENVVDIAGHPASGFAQLDSRIGPSVDMSFLQVATGRKFVSGAPGLLTVGPRSAGLRARETLLQQLDALTRLGQDTVGMASVVSIVEAGLSFVIIDEAAYTPAGVDRLVEVFGKNTQEARHFADGTGVTVLVVAP